MRLSVLLLAALLANSPALAADASLAGEASPKDVAMLHSFARCVVERREGEVRSLLALDFRKSAYDRAFRALAKSQYRCAPFYFGRLRSSPVLMAGAFAEELLRRRVAPGSLAGRLAFDPARAPIAARDEGEFMGLCIARTMPEASVALLASTPASPEEKAAAGAIAPNLGSCVRAGAQAKINRPGLRALVALAAYRLTSQQAGS
ncbi:MAG TPA: hypothetical protein VF548_08115 [Allosphingosinicella sp.]|jgi:hypothetical protein